MPRLHIILATNRRKFLGKVVEQVFDCEPHGLEVRTHILFQSDQRHMLENTFDKANEALDFIQNGWFMFMSDEDKLNPKLFSRVTELIKAFPDKECFVFSQEVRGELNFENTSHGRWNKETRILSADPKNMAPCEVGGGQFVMKRSLCGMTRHDFLNYFDNADGMFVKRIFDKNPGKFMFIDEVMMSYDAFNWREDECKEAAPSGEGRV